MSEGLNRVTLLGHLGADPEVRHTQSGTAVCNLRLATTESYMDQAGERKERTEWHSVTVWAKRGEALGRILRKGSQVLVEGRLQTTSYEKGGEKRYRTEVVAQNVVLVGKRPDDARHEPSSHERAKADGYAPDTAVGMTDDIPF